MLLSTLEYPVHMEAAYPLLVLGAYLAWRRGRHAVAIGLVVLTRRERVLRATSGKNARWRRGI